MALTVACLPVATASAATPKAHETAPHPAIGSLSSSSNPNDHGCSASIVGPNIIVTAAHCVHGERNVFFSPGYHDGQAPYGTWRGLATYVDDGWKTDNDINGTEGTGGSPYDFAFVVLEKRNGKNVAEATGSSLRLKIDAALPADVTVRGYPSAKDKPYSCDSTASRNDQHWETLQCLGIPGGFSGGPWTARGTTDVIGVIGGRGQNLPPTDARNYSVRFDAKVKALYDKAVSSPVPPGNGNLGYPLGEGSTWKHAELITSGYYTGGSQGGSRHMDMIVKWSDGEVTLYQGSTSTDPQKPFVGETRLAAPHGLWDHAKAIAAVNVGGGRDGIVVRWSDGEVTLYKTVDAGGFHEELQLAAPNDLWRDHATHIAAGRYTGNGQRDDLIVVWNDGEVTLYSDIATNKLGSEKQLAAPKSIWTHAQTISGGDYTGSATSDLLVRWSDGELTIYSDVSTGGFGTEHQVRAPNDLWTHATVVAGGAFAANQRANDLVVRWSDGEVSLYPAVDTALHREIQLVSP